MRRPVVMWLVIGTCIVFFVLAFVMAYSATTHYREQVFRPKTSSIEHPVGDIGRPA